LAHETIISLVKQCEAVFIYLHLTQWTRKQISSVFA